MLNFFKLFFNFLTNIIGQFPAHHAPPPHQFGPYPYPPNTSQPPASLLHPPTTRAPSIDTPTPATDPRSPAHSSGSASPYGTQGSRPQSYGSNDDERPRSETTTGIGTGSNTGEFSGLVSYFSSQQDDLNS